MEIHAKFVEIHGNSWKFMEIHGNLWKIYTLIENDCIHFLEH